METKIIEGFEFKRDLGQEYWWYCHDEWSDDTYVELVNGNFQAVYEGELIDNHPYAETAIQDIWDIINV